MLVFRIGPAGEICFCFFNAARRVRPTIIIVTPGQGYSAPVVGPGTITTHPAIGAAATGAPGIGAGTVGARESRQTRLFRTPFLLKAHVLRERTRSGLPTKLSEQSYD